MMATQPTLSTAIPANSRSTEDVIRGSINIPLSPDGRLQARERGLQFKRKGGVHQIYASSLNRTVETAHAVMHADPRAKLIEVTKALHPWHMGGYEGQPTRDIVPKMNALIVDYPDRYPPRPKPGSDSTDSTGETFNQFHDRVMQWLKPVLQRYLANPHTKMLLVTHYRVLKLLQAWEANHFAPDMSIDHVEVTRKDGEPGQVSRLWASDIHSTGGPDGLWATWHLQHRVPMESLDKLKDGIYIERHGFTPMNQENPGGTLSRGE